VNRWDRFLSHTMDLYWILKKVTETGILIDKVQRAEFKKTLLTALSTKEKELDELIPKELCRHKEYKLTPATFRCRECKGRGHSGGKDHEPCKDCRGTGTKITEGSEGYNGVARVPKHTELISGHVQGGSGEYYVRSIDDAGKFNWSFRWLFNSKSPLQVRDYIKWKGHPVPKHRKSGEATTGQKDLEALARRFKDPFYKKILELRSISDLLSKFADNPWWSPAKDGRIHPSFNFNPSTGRLAASRPNIQQSVKRGEYGALFRNQFIASPGMILVAIDYSSIEAVLTGWFGKDEEFIKAAKLSIHAILASHYLKQLGKWDEPISMSWDLDKIKSAISIIKKKFYPAYDQSKRVVYLSLYGGKPRMIYYQNPGVFNSIKECTQLQDMFFSTLAVKIKKWQRDVLELAHRQCYLENPFGHRHYFFDVLNEKGGMGSQAKDALAELPQSTASSIYKEVMVRLRPELTDYLLAPIHDELLFQLPENEKDDLIEEIVSEMQRPIPELDGLTIGVEWASGHRWGEMVD
jgi:DNA polymerase-1